MKEFFLTILCFAITSTDFSFSQEIRFNHILGNPSNQNGIECVAQDRYGFMWFGRYLDGLQRFDGSQLKSYQHDPYDANSIANNWVECLVIDENNIFWIGTWGSGLDRFDPSTNKFIHYRHNEKNVGSLSSDTITALLSDKSGNLWIGSYGGLDMLNKKTGEFVHYKNNPNDPESLSYNEVRVIYEDRSGKIWAGCGRPFTNFSQKPGDGGLNCLDKSTGKFKRFMKDDTDTNSISNNKVRSIFEDSRGNFWIGTRDNGIQTLNRKTGKFTHYYFDPLHSEKLSRLPGAIINGNIGDHISFITEDLHGNILIASHYQGLISYNPLSGSVKHYGYLFDADHNIVATDTTTGLTGTFLWRSFISSEGLIWITTLGGGYAFTINPHQTYMPGYSLNHRKPDVNSIYCEKNGNILWLATDEGLYKKDLRTGEQTTIKHNPLNPNSLSNDTVTSIKADSEGNLWLGTANGLCKYDPVINKFVNFYHDKKKSNGLSSNSINYLFFDHAKNLWIGTALTGIDKMNIVTGTFANYRYDDKDRRTISSDFITGIAEDRGSNIWIATSYGVNLLNIQTNKFAHFLGNSAITSVCVDHSGVIWTAVQSSVYYFDSSANMFQPFIDSNRNEKFTDVINIIEDKKQNLWLSASHSITKINAKRNAFKVYDSTNGVRPNLFGFADNFVSEKNEVFLGDQDGYYAFYPDDIIETSTPPAIIFTSFRVDDIEVQPGKQSPLDSSIENERKIQLRYNQNNFSIEFVALSYISLDDIKYLYKLDKYDNNWRYLDRSRKAYFFNVAPGNYTLHIRCVKKDGVWSEKTIAIIISSPWWATWRFRILSVIALIIVIYAIIKERSRKLKAENLLLEQKVTERTAQLKKSLEDLQSTQAQLIQSEKMASLGELTAGIAHEIQNPLNFVNNFSDVNSELIDEANQEIEKGNINEVKTILNDIKDNEQKINHHGKRADAIVKGMLQHSRASSGQKEPTDINTLTDEYLRLAYHGLRAKDKEFNADVKTGFGETIGKINVVPQDIGRVLLNLFNNAFYAVNKKKKNAVGDYQPTVTVQTKKLNDKVEIKVSDNGDGISPNILDKIFQPFFTTKPTGQGTGLGLSLAYDIIKAHGGDIKVQTKEGEGTEFVVQLPV